MGHSPVDCVKRYALLYAVREQQDGRHQAPKEPSAVERDSNLEQTQFSGLSISSDEGDSPRRGGSFIDYLSPIASPKLDAFDTFEDEFGVGSPTSPPPFAARESKPHAPSSPLRWENLANEPLAGGSPVVRSLRRMHTPSGAFGIEEESKSPGTRSPDGVRSPRIIHGTQVSSYPMLHGIFFDVGIMHPIVCLGPHEPVCESRVRRQHPQPCVQGHGDRLSAGRDLAPNDPDYLQLWCACTSPFLLGDAMALTACFLFVPEYPFVKDDDSKNPFAPTAARINQQQRSANQSMMSNLSSAQMSMMSNMSSFHGDNPFSGACVPTVRQPTGRSFVIDPVCQSIQNR